MKKLAPCVAESVSNTLVNDRYIAHCNNIARILAEYPSSKDCLTYQSSRTKEAIDYYIRVTQANVRDDT